MKLKREHLDYLDPNPRGPPQDSKVSWLASTMVERMKSLDHSSGVYLVRDVSYFYLFDV
jgi:hypothetical protein